MQTQPTRKRNHKSVKKKGRPRKEANLSDLCVTDKKKIGSLIRKLVHATTEREQNERQQFAQKEQYESDISSLRQQNGDILQETLRLKAKFRQSLKLLHEYQKRLQQSYELRAHCAKREDEVRQYKEKIANLEQQLEDAHLHQIRAAAPSVQPPPQPTPYPQIQNAQDKCRDSFCNANDHTTFSTDEIDPPRPAKYQRMLDDVATSSSTPSHRKWRAPSDGLSHKERKQRVRKLMSIQNSSSSRRHTPARSFPNSSPCCAAAFQPSHLQPRHDTQTDLIHHCSNTKPFSLPTSGRLLDAQLLDPHTADAELASEINLRPKRIPSVTEEIDIINRHEHAAINSGELFIPDWENSDVEEELELIHHLNTIPQRWDL